MGRRVWRLAAVALVAVAALTVWSGESRAQQETQVPVDQMNKPVRVGDLNYVVSQAEWEKIPYPGHATVEYLAVKLSVQNMGTETAQIPVFSIFDESGHYYPPNPWLQQFEKLSANPGETVSGTVYFLPAKDQNLWFMASGNFRSQQFAYIALKNIKGAN